MPELEGTWKVRRTGGLLPPLVGIRKEIHGTSGRTTLPRGIAGVPFDVVGLELRSKGVTFEHYDDLPGTTREGDVHTMGGQMKSAWFKDPDGNILNVGNQSV